MRKISLQNNIRIRKTFLFLQFAVTYIAYVFFASSFPSAVIAVGVGVFVVPFVFIFSNYIFNKIRELEDLQEKLERERQFRAIQEQNVPRLPHQDSSESPEGEEVHYGY